ncbi:MAG: hypothetical protein ACK2U9_23850 [Anaerolineae bacterium]|jgi:hypothetical protein
MFEQKDQPLLPRDAYLARLARFALLAAGILGTSLLVGIAGYHYLEGLGWVDSTLNAAMILGGMGPVNALHTEAGKLFAAFYALFSGVVFLVVAGVLLAPVAHRFLHRFHLGLDDDSPGDG